MKQTFKICLAVSLAINVLLVLHGFHRQKQNAFVGDSLTEGIPTAMLPPSSFNWGVSGFTTYDVSRLIGKVGRSKPDRIFLQIGINDFWNNLSVDSAFTNFQKIIDILLTDHRDTEIYAISLFPTYDSYRFLNPAAKEFNSRIENLCREKRIVYIDIYPALTSHREYTVDGMHLSEVGYRVWMDRLKPYF